MRHTTEDSNQSRRVDPETTAYHNGNFYRTIDDFFNYNELDGIVKHLNFVFDDFMEDCDLSDDAQREAFFHHNRLVLFLCALRVRWMKYKRFSPEYRNFKTGLANPKTDSHA